MRTLLVVSAVAVLAGATPDPAAVRWRPATEADIPAALATRLRQGGHGDLTAWLEMGRRDTARRMTEGAWDHAIAFALQARTFTTLPPIEPATSARQYADAGRMPTDAQRRLQAFARAVAAGPHEYVWMPMPGADPDADDLLRTLEREYGRCMQFLHDQTYTGRDADGIAALYETRGLSTDTAIEAGYAVHEGLGVAVALRPAKVRRVLVVGPGLEVAPRTDLDSETLGQSYQPIALLDSLRRLGAAHDEITVDVVDVNPAVIRHFDERAAARRDLPLTIATQLEEARDGALTAGFVEYVANWGAMVGAPGTAMRRTPDGRWQARVDVRREAWQRIRAQVADVALDVPSREAYDLVVATNVLAYLDDARVLAALHAIQRALLPGGVLLHNDRRTALVAEAGGDRLPVRQLRTVTFTESKPGRPPVYDIVVVHQRSGGGRPPNRQR